VAPPLFEPHFFLAQELVEEVSFGRAHLFVDLFGGSELLLEISRAHDGGFVGQLVRTLVD
jgi:hypothetical protein